MKDNLDIEEARSKQLSKHTVDLELCGPVELDLGKRALAISNAEKSKTTDQCKDWFHEMARLDYPHWNNFTPEQFVNEFCNYWECVPKQNGKVDGECLIRFSDDEWSLMNLAALFGVMEAFGVYTD